MLLPIWIAVTGVFSSQWELTENLRPVLGNGQGLAKWTLLPQSPTLKSLVQVLLDSPEFFTMFWNSVTITAGHSPAPSNRAASRISSGMAPKNRVSRNTG